MAILDVLNYPDERLRRPSRPVEAIDERLHGLIEDMLETMYSEQGIGLAAPQINHHLRLLVMDTSDSRDQPLALVNPEITEAQGEQEGEEGCLSLPGIYETVARAAQITVCFQDREGFQREEAFSGLPARCIQHEIDHLDGKLFVDYLSKLKRDRLRKKLEKEKRLQATSA